jgi:hypothetical protein
MNSPTDERILRSLARRLAETADRQQVIEELCLLQNLAWSRAEELVDEASALYQPDITRRQTPILVLVALAIFIGGVALAAWQLLGLVAVISALVSPRASTFWEVYSLSFGLFETLTNFWGILGAFLAGLAMVLGSYFGMREVWIVWLDAAEDGTLLAPEPVPELQELSGPQPATAVAIAYTADGWVRNHPNDEKLVDLIIDLLEKSKNRAWVVTSVALSRGLSWPAASQLVESVARSGRLESFRDRPAHPAVIFAFLGLFLTGLVISLQYLLVSAVVLRGQFLPVTDLYRLVRFLFVVGSYLESAPLPFAVFALGLVMLVGSGLALRETWASIYRWQFRS